MTGITYNAGALIAAESNRVSMWSFHRAALRQGMMCTVPTVVIAQVWRSGARQANLARLLSGCIAQPLFPDEARQAGELLGRARRADIVDAVVVLGAVGRGDAVVTSNPDDIEALADAVGVRIITIEP